MQQHPVPQNVTQYQFRLVGDMTLKQFLELALGLVLAYLFYASNLVFVFKWPLVILSILFGAGLAFFPIEDRPLDQWIVNFVRSIYAPTRFIWKKTDKVPPLFVFEAHAGDAVTTITKTIKAPAVSTQKDAVVSDLSETETARLAMLDSLFATQPAAPAEARALADQPSLVDRPTVSVRKLSPAAAVSGLVAHAPIISPPSPAIAKALTGPAPENVIFTAPTAIARQSLGDGRPLGSPKRVALPASPKLPNLVTGVVVDQHDKLVENAIVQIVSGDGIPQRAMKTNSLGQFYTSTPLSPGSYVVEVDKVGATFAPQQIMINNTIFTPIELRASS